MPAWSEEETELYEFARETANEWWGLRVIDDRQFIALQSLLHEMEKKVYFEWRSDDEGN